jgi:hypothetical protein
MDSEGTRHRLLYYLALGASLVAFVFLLTGGASAAISLPIGVVFFALLFSWRRRAAESPAYLREIPVVSVALGRLSKAQVIATAFLVAGVLSAAILVFQATRRPLIVIVYPLAVVAIVFAIGIFQLIRAIRMDGWRGDKRAEK